MNWHFKIFTPYFLGMDSSSEGIDLSQQYVPYGKKYEINTCSKWLRSSICCRCFALFFYIPVLFSLAPPLYASPYITVRECVY